MARPAVLTPERRAQALEAATAEHERQSAELVALETSAAGQATAQSAAAQAEAAARAAREEAEAKLAEANRKVEEEAAAQAESARLAEEAKRAGEILLQAREKARKSGQVIAAAYDEHESAMLYGKFAAIIAENPTVHPHVVLFALSMATDTVLRKARKRYGIPG